MSDRHLEFPKCKFPNQGQPCFWTLAVSRCFSALNLTTQRPKLQGFKPAVRRDSMLHVCRTGKKTCRASTRTLGTGNLCCSVLHVRRTHREEPKRRARRPLVSAGCSRALSRPSSSGLAGHPSPIIVATRSLHVLHPHSMQWHMAASAARSTA